MLPELTKDYVTYQAQTKLLELGVDIADARLRINKPSIKAKFNLAVKIRLWLKALSYSDYLDQDTITKLVLCLAELCDANAIPYAPVLTTNSPPSITIGGSTVVNNYYYNAYTPFSNPTVTNPNGILDQFPVSDGNGVRWEYVIVSGSNLRKGNFSTGWLTDGTSISDGEEISAADIGNTNAVVLSCDISGGNVRLIATVSSGTWIIYGKRYLG